MTAPAPNDLAAILDGVNDCVLAFDAAFRFTYVNANGARVLGRTRESLLGTHLWEEFPELEASSFGVAYRAAMAERMPKTLEDYYQPFGAWFEARAFPSQGGLVVFFRDVTERHRFQESLLESEQRYRSFVAQSTEGIWRVEATPPVEVSLPVAAQLEAMFQRGILAECNDAMARMYGFERASALEGTPLSVLLPPDDPKNREYLAAFVESGYRLENAESRERDREGRLRIFENSLVGLVEDGMLVRAWGTQRDITAQVEARVEAERLTSQLQEAVRIRDDFLSIASHELKTPLTPLGLRLEVLARELERQPDSPLAPAVSRYLETGRRQLRKLNELVNDLLDVSRISAGRFSISWEQVDLTPLVREVAARFEPEAARAGSRLTVFADGPLEGEWDRLRLEQVAENLISNAVKYGGGTPIEVRLRADEEAGHALLTVSDGGIGIEPEAQQRIFERFERAVSAHHYGGLGLGLYITRTIVNLLGGEIRVESGEGRGTTFEVRLPFHRVTSPP